MNVGMAQYTSSGTMYLKTPKTLKEMKKITITQYTKESCGTTLGAYIYNYHINYNGDYAYVLQTTKESMGYLIEALKIGNEVIFQDLTSINPKNT